MTSGPRAQDAATAASFWTDERVNVLLRVNTALTSRAPAEAVAELVADEIIAALGAATCALYFIEADGQWARAVATRGWKAKHASYFGRIQLGGDNPLAAALGALEPLWLESRAAYRERFPDAERAGRVDDSEVAIGCVPMINNGKSIGALAISFGARRPLDDELKDFLVFLAQHCASALERARLHDEVERARQRLEVLAEVGDRLAKSLDYETTLTNVVRAAMPVLGDFGFFDLVEGDGVRRIPYAHEDPRRQEILAPTGWVKNERTDMNLCALSSGAVGVHADIDDAWLRSVAVAPPHFELMRSLDFQSMITVPLRAGDALLGALTLFFVSGGRRHSQEDVRLAADVASRAASALLNAKLYRSATDAEREARDALRARDEFLSIASHELRTPISTLEMGLALIQRTVEERSEQLSPKGVGRLHKSIRQVHRLKDLVEQLMDVSRIASGRLELDRAPTELDALLREVVERLPDDGARLELSLPPTPVSGAFDRARLDQVVTNLLSNALKYGGDQPVTLVLSAAAEHARIQVIDQGIGIAEEDQRRIFSRFERAVPIRNYGGFGLGLWISQQIVAAHGGTIRVESAPGHGATFTVELPLAP